jgi:hypothetical protein
VVKDNNWNWQLSAPLEPGVFPKRFSVGKRYGHVNFEAMACLTQKQRKHIGQVYRGAWKCPSINLKTVLSVTSENLAAAAPLGWWDPETLFAAQKSVRYLVLLESSHNLARQLRP